MQTLTLDLETYSSADLKRVGAAKYAEAEDFEILLMSYAVDDEPVRVWDFTKNGVPWFLAKALTDPEVLKVAWNIAFERSCFQAALGVYSPPEQWRDAMTLAAMNGLPMTLEGTGEALNLEEQKLSTGTALINYFCKPCKPTIKNGGRTRNLPEHDPEKWADFITYCKRDTETERAIYKRLLTFPVSDFERRLEAMDARMNERGVEVDLTLAESAVSVDEALKAENTEEMQRLTGLANPNSVQQLKTWLEAVGISVDSLDKGTVADLKGEIKSPTVRRVLELRQLMGKTSTKKYQAMLEAACSDGRVRGLLQYYGAGRTGRWAGRRVQLQNLAQNHLDEIDQVRELVKSRDLATLELCFDSVPDVLSQLIRTAFVAKDGHTFLVADYSAIEARVIAYLACEQWRMDVFAGSGKIYETSYAQAFNVPVASVKKGSPERQKGKIMELALGYGGGVKALVAFGADKLGLTDDEMQDLVNRWRMASPTIPRLWSRVEEAAKRALANPGRRCAVTHPAGAVAIYWRDKDALRCQLPSGRVLSYWGARLEEYKGRPSVVFMGQNQTTRKWEKTETWGGKLVENIVQAFARDCLAEALLQLDAAGYATVFHVHDEIVAEAPDGSRWEDMAEVMSRPIPWAPGLLLRADGYDTKFYKKD